MACLPPSDDGHPALRGTLLAAAITSVCSAGFLLLGFDQGAMSGVVLSPAWRDTMGVPSDLAIGTLTALFTVGAVLGALFSAVHAETLGRKGTLFLGALLVLKGAVMQAASTGQIIFGLGRVTAGLGIGQVTAVAPVYQSETAGSGQRGWRIACQLTAMLVGLFLAHMVNYGFYFSPGQAQWRVPLALQTIFALYVLAVTPFLPDTPRLLMKKYPDTPGRGIAVLSRLRDGMATGAAILKERDGIFRTLVEEGNKGKWSDLLKPGGAEIDKRFYLAVGIHFMQQMSGINIVTYSLPILAITSLNLGVHDALLLGVFAQLWYALASLATWWTIDRVGRRPLLVVNAVAMSFLLFVLSMSVLVGATTVVHPRPPAAAIAGVIATVCVFLFEAAFTWGWMASVWIYPPEILPLGIRARGTAVASAAGFFGNLVVVAVTPIGIARLGWVFYLLWALFDLVNAAVVWMVYPETGGLELEIVDKIFTVEVPFAQEEEVHDPGHVGFCTGYVRKTQALQWDRVKLAALLKANRARVLPEQRPLLDSFLDE